MSLFERSVRQRDEKRYKKMRFKKPGQPAARRLFPDRSAMIGMCHNKKHEKEHEDQKNFE